MASTMFSSPTKSDFQTPVTTVPARRSRTGAFLKRAFDIFVAFLGLFFLSPFFLIIASFIRRDSPGPVFFHCCRMGRNGQPFRMLKFRTMYENPESYAGPCVTCAEDTRITPFGRWLRDTKINELPQLWNVLIGEMSLVGPRPEDLDIVTGWSEEDRAQILSVRPGITSPASILYRDEEKMLSQGTLMEDYLQKILPDKLRLDRLYVQNHTLTSDLDILFWTMVIIIPNMVRTQIPEGYLFAGPITRLFNRHLSWFILDVGISLVVVAGIALLWRVQSAFHWGPLNLAWISLIIALVFSGFNLVSGLNRIVWKSATLFDAVRLSLSSWAVTIVLLLANYSLEKTTWLPLPALPVSLILLIGIFTQIGFVVARYRWRIITSLASRWLTLRRSRMELGEKLLIVGAGGNFQTAAWLLQREEFQFIFQIVGVVDDHILANHGMILNGCTVLGKVSDLPRIVQEKEINFIVFTTLDVPAETKIFVENLQRTNQVRLIFLDNILKMISEQITIPLNRPRVSLWSDEYRQYLATHDGFTGLPNRLLFQDRVLHSLALSRRYHTRPVVLFVELDLLNRAEDFPQSTWDLLIQQIIERLMKFKRESDSLGYLENGCFAYLMENVINQASIDAIVLRLERTLAQSLTVVDQVFHLKATISVCPDMEDCLKSHQELHPFLDTLFSIRQVEKVVHAE